MEAPRLGGSKPPPSVRKVIAYLVLVCFVPGLLGGLAFILREYYGDRDALQLRTLQTARAMVQTVDAQLDQAELLALALASSGRLTRRDFEDFHQRAQSLINASQFAGGVVLYDNQGQQLLNTRVPFGRALPQRKNIAQIRNVFASAKAVSSEVLPSSLDGTPMVSVAVPVFDAGKVVYALSVGITSERLNGLLSVQGLPAQWVVGILDPAGTIAARTVAPEKFVGQPAAAMLLAQMRAAPEGMFEGLTRDGIDTLSVFSTSGRSGWTVAIGVPKASFEAPLMRSLLWLGFGAGMVLLVSIGLARYLGGRIATAMAGLNRYVQAMANGENLAPQSLQIQEADAVALAIAHAASMLAQRSEALVATHAVLVRREAELADAQRIAGIGSWTWDVASDETQYSQEVYAIFGRQEIPHFSEQSATLFPHEAWLALRQARLNMARTGKAYQLELPAFRQDGSPIWVYLRSEVVRDADGTVLGMKGTVQDITERKHSESIAHSERFIRVITNAIPSMVAYWDSKLRCKFANQSYLDWWDKSEAAILEVSLQELMGESLFLVNEPLIRAALRGEAQSFERFLTRPDGSQGHVLAQYLPARDAHGRVQGFIMLVSDIRAVKLAEGELKLAANIYQNVTEAIMVTDLSGTILSVNPAFTQITGFPAQEAVGQPSRLLRSDRHDPAFYASLWEQLQASGQWKGEIWNRRKNGEVYLEWQTITRIGASGDASSRYVCVFHDVTDTWHANEANRHLALHDALTDLPNRTLLIERLERQIAIAEREPRQIAVLFLDLDGFKAVNDALGHAAGDALLIAVARKLQSLVRQTDTVARLGGDEFVIKLDRPENRDEVVHVAERILQTINEPLDIQGHAIQLGISIGIAVYPENGHSAEALIRHADEAMYEAKKLGRNQHRFFSSELAGL